MNELFQILGAPRSRPLAALAAGVALGCLIGTGFLHRSTRPAPPLLGQKPVGGDALGVVEPATASIEELVRRWEMVSLGGDGPGREAAALRLAHTLAREPVAEWRAWLRDTDLPAEENLHVLALAVGCLAHQTDVSTALSARDELIRTTGEAEQLASRGFAPHMMVDRILQLAPEAVFAHLADPSVEDSSREPFLGKLQLAALLAPEAAEAFLVQQATHSDLNSNLEIVASGILLADPGRAASLITRTSESDAWHQALASAVADFSSPGAEVLCRAEFGSLTPRLQEAVACAAVRAGPEVLRELEANGAPSEARESALIAAVRNSLVSTGAARWFLEQDAAAFPSTDSDFWRKMASALPADELAEWCRAGASAPDSGPRQQALRDILVATEALDDPGALADRLARGEPPPPLETLELISDRLLDPDDPAMARLRQSLPADTWGAMASRHLENPALAPDVCATLVRASIGSLENISSAGGPMNDSDINDGLAQAGERLAREAPETFDALAIELKDHPSARPFLTEGLAALAQVDPGRFSEHLATFPEGDDRDRLVREWVTHAVDDLDSVTAWARTLSDPADRARHLEVLEIEAEFRARSAPAHRAGP